MRAHLVHEELTSRICSKRILRICAREGLTANYTIEATSCRPSTAISQNLTFFFWCTRTSTMESTIASARSGITQTASGDAFIPSSTRPDGTKRKEIRVRPGYVPPEDVETYRNQRANAFKNRSKAGIPGAEALQSSVTITDGKSKNAKRREAAKKKAETQPNSDELTDALREQNLGEDELKEDRQNTEKLQTGTTPIEADEAERQKKIRNLLKKLKAMRELKEKKSAGEKLSVDQIAKIGKEPELIRDLRKLKYDGLEIENGTGDGDVASNQGHNIA